MASIVSVRNLSKSYKRGSQKVSVLSNLNLEVEEGEFLALMGPSGSGKTTLLKIIAGLLDPTEGEVRIRGNKVTGPGPDRGERTRHIPTRTRRAVEIRDRMRCRVHFEPAKAVHEECQERCHRRQPSARRRLPAA